MLSSSLDWCLYVVLSLVSGSNRTSRSSVRSSLRSASNDVCSWCHCRLFSSTLSYIGVKRALNDAKDYTQIIIIIIIIVRFALRLTYSCTTMSVRVNKSCALKTNDRHMWQALRSMNLKTHGVSPCNVRRTSTLATRLPREHACCVWAW